MAVLAEIFFCRVFSYQFFKKRKYKSQHCRDKTTKSFLVLGKNITIFFNNQIHRTRFRSIKHNSILKKEIVAFCYHRFYNFVKRSASEDIFCGFS